MWDAPAVSATTLLTARREARMSPKLASDLPLFLAVTARASWMRRWQMSCHNAVSWRQLEPSFSAESLEVFVSSRIWVLVFWRRTRMRVGVVTNTHTHAGHFFSATAPLFTSSVPAAIFDSQFSLTSCS